MRVGFRGVAETGEGVAKEVTRTEWAFSPDYTAHACVCVGCKAMFNAEGKVYASQALNTS